MKERKLQQDNFSTKLGRSPEKLAMHQGDSYRPKQEERQVADQILSSLCLVYVHMCVCGCRIQIDRAIPPLDYGKGCMRCVVC